MMKKVKTKKVPQRSCIGCGEKKNKSEFIRIVRTPEGELVLDKTGKMPGRGAYLCLSEECLKKAVKKRTIERALGVEVNDDLLVILTNQIKE